MSGEEAATIANAAYRYMIQVLVAGGTAADKISNARIEELTLDEATQNYKVTISYDVTGNFEFDRKREYKDFIVDKESKVLSMKIRTL